MRAIQLAAMAICNMDNSTDDWYHLAPEDIGYVRWYNEAAQAVLDAIGYDKLMTVVEAANGHAHNDLFMADGCLLCAALEACTLVDLPLATDLVGPF